MRFNARFLCVFALLFALVLPAGAETLTVTSENDAGTGSLRQAVLTANASSGQDTVINIDESVKLINVNTMMTLEGNVAIHGNGVTLQAANSRIFNVTGGTAAFDRVTFTGGRATNENGGAVNISGNASAQFANCTFFGNSANAYGGAVCVNSSGTVATVFQSCTVAGNSAQDGGGVAVVQGTAQFNACIVAGNSGSAGADNDVCRAETGAVNAGSYNVIGVTADVETSSFSESRNNHTGVDAASVFAQDPPALETENKIQFLRLSSSTGNAALDLIPTGTAGQPNEDGRGVSRPQLLGYDAGAFEAEPVGVQSVKVVGSSYIQFGTTETYTLETTPSGASRNKTYSEGVEWSGSNPSVIEVSADGTVRALQIGEAVLYAKFHGWDAAGRETAVDAVPFRIYVGETPVPTPALSIDVIPAQSVQVGQTALVNPRPKVTVKLNDYEVPLPYTLKITSISDGAVVRAVVSGDDIHLDGLASGSSTVAVMASAKNSAGMEGSSAPQFFTVNVSQMGSNKGSGGGCDAGFPSALAALLGLGAFLRAGDSGHAGGRPRGASGFIKSR
ncbi:MAG: hypothetical protein IJ702_04545 [Fretibacterium sp.]|nr:hypothetical protein [Fretibacterium sp.]